MKGKSILGIGIVYFMVIAAFLAVTYLSNLATSVVAEMIPVEREVTVVIDPGHGGIDGGATSCSGVLESNINLEISSRLNDLLRLLGYHTVMVRTTDRSIHIQGQTIAAKKVSDLRQRVKLVNEQENALLISIHQNTFPDSRYSGAQVFFGPKGEGATLAENLQNALVKSVNPGSNRKAKKAEGIYLMQHIDCTGILVECGFISNPEEESKLRQKIYQQQLCCVIGASVANFLDG